MKIKIGSADLIQENQSRLVVIDGKEIVLIKHKDKFYAIDNKCPHQGVGLCTGKIKGTTITCPGHGWEFDYTSGEGVVMPVSVKTYPVTQEENELCIELSL